MTGKALVPHEGAEVNKRDAQRKDVPIFAVLRALSGLLHASR